MSLKKLLQNKSFLQKCFLTILAINLLLMIILFSIGVSDKYGGKSLWQSVSSSMNNPMLQLFSVMLWILIFFIIGWSIYTVIIYFIKKDIREKMVRVTVIASLAMVFGIVLIAIVFRLYSEAWWFLAVLAVLLNIVNFTLYLFYRKNEEVQANKISKGFRMVKFPRYISLIMDCLGTFFVFLTLFIPFIKKRGIQFVASSILKNNPFTPDVFVISTIVFALFMAALLIFITTVTLYITNDSKYIRRSRMLTRYNLIVTSLFFLIGYLYVFIFTLRNVEVSTVSFVPLIFMVLIFIASSFIQANTENLDDDLPESEKKIKERLHAIPLGFVFLFTAIILISLVFNFINLNITIDGEVQTYHLTGLDILMDYDNLNSVFQIFASVYTIILIISVVSAIVCLVTYLGRSKDYYKMVKFSVYTNLILSCIFAVIGIMILFNQKLLNESVKIILQYLNIYVPTLYTYKISSDVIIVFFLALALFTTMVLTKQLNLTFKPNFDGVGTIESTGSTDTSISSSTSNGDLNFDPCPVFTELDRKKEILSKEYGLRQANIFSNPTLPDIVDFVVKYARNSRLHLSYSYDDIASFVAGLGASRLAILQGMSGTGKTSLPKIFAEAIFGSCELIEVESSWRDKNELIGYYNEFSKIFTPKKFTQSLYKAKLNENVITLIVLDEMNLSRVEYYFSDFLSLMEAEEDFREIKLLNLKIFPNDSGSYLGLEEGHTLKIPKNVWFVGTANRDESTFEISDKVYDRAQTMNFDKRAPKIRSYQDEMEPQFLPYDILENLFQEAKSSIHYDAENDEIIQEVEKILVPYNILFGNRILNQMEDYIKIYCSCYTSINETGAKAVLKNAVENILFSKVIRKLEVKLIDNKEKLAQAFERLELYKCSAFIRRLDEE